MRSYRPKAHESSGSATNAPASSAINSRPERPACDASTARAAPLDGRDGAATLPLPTDADCSFTEARPLRGSRPQTDAARGGGGVVDGEDWLVIDRGGHPWAIDLHSQHVPFVAVRAIQL